MASEKGQPNAKVSKLQFMGQICLFIHEWPMSQQWFVFSQLLEKNF